MRSCSRPSLPEWLMRMTMNATVKLASPVQSFVAHCLRYKGAELKTSLIQLSVTLFLFFMLCAGMMWAAVQGYYWALPVALLPAAGLLVRIFIIQHDCGHGSYFKKRRTNDLVGSLLGLLTFTPYAFWRDSHNLHHASSGNLSRRGLGSIDTLTVREYNALPRNKQLAYRLYRNNFLLLVLGTPLHVLILQRMPPMKGMSLIVEYRSIPLGRALKSIMALNLALAVFYGLLMAWLGAAMVVMVYLPILVVTAWIGGWLFFVQHQFEDTIWEHNENWSHQEASLYGSSHYVLPPVLQWFTGSIGLHHIHHLCALIPNYKLQQCADDNAELKNLNRMTVRQSLECLRWKLWDEGRSRMVSFRDARNTA